MSLSDEINKAVGAHGMWKTRLVAAIESGKCEIPAEKAGKDDQCDFGKWLYGTTISAQDKASADYAKIRDLHKQFHGVCGKILECVAAGKKDGCQQMLDGEFKAISTKLTSAMVEWKSKAG